MIFTLLKVGLAAMVIVFASWLARTKPEIAGFITALPLVSIIAIAFAYTNSGDVENTAQYARSIVFAVPASWLFFLPFFLTEKWGLGFWVSWSLGLVLLCLGYFLHQWLLKLFG